MSPRWYTARLVERRAQTDTARSLDFEVLDWPGHLPGQHVDVRLTADDGYQAVRSYSLAAPTTGQRIELGVQAVPDGEVSPYLADVLPVGAEVEVRGPLGQWFVLRSEQRDPALLVAGGAGVVPLMSMIRARRGTMPRNPLRLLYSVRDPEQVWYRQELTSADGLVDASVLYTRQAPLDSSRPPHRITPTDVMRQMEQPHHDDGTIYVCGPTGFVETVSDLLVDLGEVPTAIRTERFG